MGITGKDSGEVVSFTEHFRRLKTCVDDHPENLIEDAIRDESIVDLCNALWWDAFMLRNAERRHPELFTAPVDPAFIRHWRDYETRYDDLVSWISATVFLGSLASDEPFDLATELRGSRTRPMKPEQIWESADHAAAEKVALIEAACSFASDQIGQDDRWDDDQEDWIHDIENGLELWKLLPAQVGLDVRGVFRRRELVPFVMIPRKIANANGKRLRLLNNLREAQSAFVYGLDSASLALMRATLEATLTSGHFKIFGNDLEEKITALRNRLPLGVSVNALHKLRTDANAVLHQGGDVEERDRKTHEIELMASLKALRALIEAIE